MNIIVCIKQVPDTTEVRIDPKTNTLIREGVPSIINPFDMYAIEEGLRIREKLGGTVTVLSMGPPQVKEALRETIAMCADEAVLLTDRAFAGADTWATSYTLSRGISKLGNADLIICGKQAMDGDTAQVGPGIAAFLDIPQVTYVKKIREISADKMIAERQTETGYDVLEVELPALITVLKEINEPRMASLKGKLRAKKYEPKLLSVADVEADKAKIGLDGSPTRVKNIFSPRAKEGGEIIEGEVSELADKIMDFLKKKQYI